jgi:hypothetical protein
MKILFEITGNQKGFQRQLELDLDRDTDIETLGYTYTSLERLLIFISKVIKDLDPEELQRLSIGVNQAESEARDNPNWPFEKTMIKEQTPPNPES